MQKRKKYQQIEIGQKFERLKVLECLGIKKYNQTFWRCECICGNIVETTTGALNAHSIKSCGCFRTELQKKTLEMRGSRYREITGNYWASIKNGARQRSLEFSITIEDAWKQFIKQKRCCALTGITLIMDTNTHIKGTASLDRIDSNKGYVKNNIQWVSKDINKAKNTKTNDEFIWLCRQVVNYCGDK